MKKFGLPTYPIIDDMSMGTKRMLDELEWLLEHGVLTCWDFKIIKAATRYQLWHSLGEDMPQAETSSLQELVRALPELVYHLCHAISEWRWRASSEQVEEKFGLPTYPIINGMGIGDWRSPDELEWLLEYGVLTCLDFQIIKRTTHYRLLRLDQDWDNIPTLPEALDRVTLAEESTLQELVQMLPELLPPSAWPDFAQWGWRERELRVLKRKRV